MTGLGVSTQDTIGVAWGAKWIACNAINQGVSSGFDQDIVTAYQWLADPDGNPNTVDDVPDVVCNSWRVNEGFGGTPPYTDCDSRWWTVIDNCEAAGVVTCWAAGNEGPGGSTVGSPADRATIVDERLLRGRRQRDRRPAVPLRRSPDSPAAARAAATFRPRRRSSRKCAHPAWASTPPSRAAAIRAAGTAPRWPTPHVAGVVALIRQANPSLDVETIKTILMETARDEGAAGEDNNYGWGFIDAQAAVIAATVGFGQLEGHAYNQTWNNVPLPGVKVKLIETGIQYTTNAQGYYSGSAAAGSYNVQASLDGFQTLTFPLVLTASETTTQDLYLTDNVAPAITNVTQLGSTTDTAGPYAISATITDPSTVASTALFYRVNGGLWVEAPMTLSGGDLRGLDPRTAGGDQDRLLRARYRRPGPGRREPGRRSGQLLQPLHHPDRPHL